MAEVYWSSAALAQASFLTTILLTVFTALFVYRVSTKGIVLQGEELFITSLETVADKVYDYDPVTESEPFYENLKGNPICY